jgi:hypothetical protein
METKESGASRCERSPRRRFSPWLIGFDALLIFVARVVLWFRNENAVVATGILSPRSALLAARSIGIVAFAFAVAGFATVPAGLYGRRSCIRVNSSSPVPASTSTWLENALNNPRHVA